MDLLADADGALKALDRDLPGEETLDDFDDEEGALLVELPGRGEGLAEGQALNSDRRREVAEAEAVFLGAVANVRKFGGDLEREGRSVTKDGEVSGLAGLVLQVGEDGRDGMKLEAVDAEDLVVGLKAGANGWHAGLERVDLDRCVLHLRDEADLFKGEFVRGAFGLDEEFGVGALAVVDEGEGDCLVEIQDGAV